MADSSWTVGADEALTRLDKFLASPDRLGSRSRAADALHKGKVFLNEGEATPAQAAQRLSAGDTVRVWMDRPGSARRTPKLATPPHSPALRLVYDDDEILVVDKPPGLLTVPLERQEDAPSVYSLLREHLRSRRRHPHVVHRIDRDSSGLVVFAKDPHTQQQLRGQFKRREAERIYLAVVYGRPAPREGTWVDHVVWDARALIMKEADRNDPRGKEAISDYRVIDTFEATALIEVRLRTGKRNQIRLQAQLRGHPLVGEQRYVGEPGPARIVRFPRQALHAHRLAFQHPTSARRLELEAPIPADFERLLAKLRRL